MVRFKAAEDRLEVFSKENLHSSMVRFKGLFSRFYLGRPNIYIPVWFDLKKANKLLTYWEYNLHSSMVRFKARRVR